jgi:hypothetical protein
VSGWQQSVSHFPRINVEGRHLKALARVVEEQELMLGDETPLEKLFVDFSVMEASSMRQEWPELKDSQIGTFNYSPYQPSRDDIPEMKAFIHGWVGLNAQLHQDVWDQVLMGGYSESIIRIKVGPVEFEGKNWRWDVAKNPSLFVTSVSIDFKRFAPAT